jgi:hypothetical protein
MESSLVTLKQNNGFRNKIIWLISPSEYTGGDIFISENTNIFGSLSDLLNCIIPHFQ